MERVVNCKYVIYVANVNILCCVNDKGVWLCQTRISQMRLDTVLGLHFSLETKYTCEHNNPTVTVRSKVYMFQVQIFH